MRIGWSFCETVDLVIAAAAQLIALIKPDPRTMIETACSVGGAVREWLSRWIDGYCNKLHVPASLLVVENAHIVETLREGGPQVGISIMQDDMFLFADWFLLGPSH